MTLDEFDRLEQAATPVPWAVQGPRVVDADGGALMWRPVTGNEADVAFAAAARNALPALLRLARAVAKEKDAAQAMDKAITDGQYLGAQARYNRAVMETAAALEALQ